ncbi:MAG TPA: hemolysin family protein [Acidimicrobiia bacterium]|nr:hemolysin family protein [Acidimicrobiia bacterium]
MSTWTALAVGVALLVANGFFVAAEFALLAARRARLEQLSDAGERRAELAVRSLRELTVMLAGAQLGITMASLGLGAVAEPAVAGVIEDAVSLVVDLPDGLLHAISFVVALSIVVFLHMVLGEMAPKSWAITHPESSALRLIRPFRVFTTLFRPVLVALNGAANLLVRVVGVPPRDEVSMALSSAELQVLLQRAVAGGAIDIDVHELLTRSLELSGLQARHAMTPRGEIVAVSADAPLAEVEDTARAAGRARLVVHEGDLDHVAGMVLARDVLLVDDVARPSTTARSLLRDVVHTTQDRPLEDLLLEMRATRRHLATVTDDRGRVVGLVTVQDVLDELVGEFDRPGE